MEQGLQKLQESLVHVKKDFNPCDGGVNKKKEKGKCLLSKSIVYRTATTFHFSHRTIIPNLL